MKKANPDCEFCNGTGWSEMAGWWAISQTAIQIPCEACKPMSYQHEYPEFEMPHELVALLHEGIMEDASWHNDVCPHFERELGNGYTMTLWIDFANANHRDMGADVLRFRLYLWPNDAVERALTVFETEADLPAMVEKVRALAAILPTPTPACSYIEAIEQVAQRMEGAEIVNTGGGIMCVIVRRGSKIFMLGTADDTWGADVYASQEAMENGDPEGSIQTLIPGDSADFDEIVRRLEVRMAVTGILDAGKELL